MVRTPYFSIIVPVYNVEQYIEEAIQSLLTQTFENFEVILVNDGSTDKSREIAENFLNVDKRIKMFDQLNRGLSSARNTGIDKATGKYIYFMDSDDSIKSDTLQVLNSELLASDCDLVAFSAGVFCNPDDKNIFTEEMFEKANTFYNRPFLTKGVMKSLDYYEAMSFNNNFVASACLYALKTSVLRKLNLRFKENIIHEDELFTRKLLFQIDKVSFITQQLYNRRVRPHSISTSSSLLKKTNSFIKIAEELYEFEKEYVNEYLQNDIEFFYNKAYENLRKIYKGGIIYSSVLASYLNSNLQQKFPISFKTKVRLHLNKFVSNNYFK